MELATVLGAFSQVSGIEEIVIVDNSDLPYMDNPIFVMLQEAYSRLGIELLFVRKSERVSVMWGKYLAVRHCTTSHVLVWDDDSIPMTSLHDVPSRLTDQYSVMSWCFLDAVNYLGYADREDWCSPEEWKADDLIHPLTIQYRWFDSQIYDRIVTPWGGNGIFLIERKLWIAFCENQGLDLVSDLGIRSASGEVFLNVAYGRAVNKPAVIYFQDRLLNMYHPSQPREWDLSTFDATVETLKCVYVDGLKAYFSNADESKTKEIG